MKIQVRSSFNGLVQEVDISMAGCGGFCPPLPYDCSEGFQIIDGTYDEFNGHFETTAQQGSFYGAQAPVATMLVIGFFTVSPVPGCAIESPGTATASIEMLFNGQSQGQAGIVFDAFTGQYFVVVTGNLPDTNGCLSFGSSSCSNFAV